MAGAVAVALAAVSVGVVVIRNAASTGYWGGPLLAAESSGRDPFDTPGKARNAQTEEVEEGKDTLGGSHDHATTPHTYEGADNSHADSYEYEDGYEGAHDPHAHPDADELHPHREQTRVSASFTLAYVRVQGSSKINSEGVTC